MSVNRIEMALLASHCGEKRKIDAEKCAGCIVIRHDKVILSCPRCGREERRNGSWVVEKIIGEKLDHEFFNTILEMHLDPKVRKV